MVTFWMESQRVYFVWRDGVFLDIEWRIFKPFQQGHVHEEW